MFYLTMHAAHFIYGYMESDIWYRTTQIAREETSYSHMGYSFRLQARLLLYPSSHRQDNTNHGLCYTSRGTLAGRKKTRKTEGNKKKKEIKIRNEIEKEEDGYRNLKKAEKDKEKSKEKLKEIRNKKKRKRNEIEKEEDGYKKLMKAGKRVKEQWKTNPFYTIVIFNYSKIIGNFD